MEPPCAGCSITPFHKRHCQSMCPRTTIRCSASIGGWRICTSLALKRSNPFPSFHSRTRRGAHDRYATARVSRSSILLDSNRSRAEAPHLLRLLQPTPLSYWTQRRNAKHLWTEKGVSLCNASVIPMAEISPRHVSSAGSSVIIRIRDRQGCLGHFFLRRRKIPIPDHLRRLRTLRITSSPGRA